MNPLSDLLYLDFLEPSGLAVLSDLITKHTPQVMPHEIANVLEINYWQALALLVACGSRGLATLFVAIYHACEPDLMVALTPMEDGLPRLPWRCPNCGSIVNDEDELSFDYLARFLGEEC